MKTIYRVTNRNNQWRGAYDASYNKPNQPSPLEQAIINAKTHGGEVWEVVENTEKQVWPK